MDGEIQDICNALIAENQLQMLAQLENEYSKQDRDKELNKRVSKRL